MNNDKCRCGCKNYQICEKYYIWYPATCICENRNYLVNIIDDLVIICDEIIGVEAQLNNEEVKTVPKNFNEKEATCKTQNSMFYLHFY